MDGFLIIDKPRGLSSHDVVRAVRRILKIQRVGHTGTLDPLATGVLPVAIGFATRLVEFFVTEDKSYLATMELGKATTTLDAEGEITHTLPYDGLQRSDVEQVAQTFLGTIEQIPPMFSALKVQGTPLYRLARKGIEVKRQARQVRINRLAVLGFDLPYVRLEVSCSKGTYIRTLCQDMAEAMGTVGYLSSLQRTRNGDFTLLDAVSLEELEKTPAGALPGGFIPMMAAMKHYPRFELTCQSAERLKHGVPPPLSGLEAKPECRTGEIVTLCRENELLAVARFNTERSTEKRGDFELLRVFN